MIEAEIMDGAMEVEGVEDGKIQLDPFVQPPILKAFFDVLPLEELAKCRSVSKLWYKESLSTWRSNATLKFGKEGIFSGKDENSGLILISLGEFLDLWEAGDWGSCCPFKQFELCFWKFKAEDVEQQRFLQLVGGHTTSLTVYECEFGGADNFRRIVYQALPKLPFLEICGCYVGADYGSTEEVTVYEEPTFWVHGLRSLHMFECPPSSILMDLLSHFHKIKSLHLEPEDQTEYRNMLETIRLIRAQDKTKLPLKNFDVNFTFWLGKDTQDTASYVELLKLQDQLNLPLQRLQICFDLDDEDLNSVLKNKDLFRDILQGHSSRLKYLKFSGNDPPRLYKSFPFGLCLQKLAELELSPQTFDNLNYLRATPNLRVLRLEYMAFEDLGVAESDNIFSNSGQLEIGDWKLPTLTELILHEFALSNCSLGKLMKWMPNLERLRMQLDDVKFSMVCSNWKNLKILEERGMELTDEGLIGRENVPGADGAEGTQSVPNITKLRNLTSFETHSSTLTSASVHEGFLKLTNLKELSLRNFKELDDETKAAIKRRKIGKFQERD